MSVKLPGPPCRLTPNLCHLHRRYPSRSPPSPVSITDHHLLHYHHQLPLLTPQPTTSTLPNPSIVAPITDHRCHLFFRHHSSNPLANPDLRPLSSPPLYPAAPPCLSLPNTQKVISTEAVLPLSSRVARPDLSSDSGATDRCRQTLSVLNLADLRLYPSRSPLFLARTDAEPPGAVGQANADLDRSAINPPLLSGSIVGLALDSTHPSRRSDLHKQRPSP